MSTIIIAIKTTGFTRADDIYELVALDEDGKLIMDQLLHTRVLPSGPLAESLTRQDLDDAPPWIDFFPELEELVKGNDLVVNNLGFLISKHPWIAEEAKSLTNGSWLWPAESFNLGTPRTAGKECEDLRQAWIQDHERKPSLPESSEFATRYHIELSTDELRCVVEGLAQTGAAATLAFKLADQLLSGMTEEVQMALGDQIPWNDGDGRLASVLALRDELGAIVGEPALRLPPWKGLV